MENDHIYLDLNIFNQLGNDPLIANFSETRSSNYLIHPNDYKLAIVRWDIPPSSFPLFIFRIQEGILQNNVNLGQYSVSLVDTASSDIFTEDVIYVPSDINPIPKSPANNFGIGDYDNKYYFIYTVDSILAMFNTALETAFTALKFSHPGNPATRSPFFTFDSVTKYISLYVQEEYLDGNDIEIYTDLYGSQLLFSGFDLSISYTPITYARFVLLSNILETNKFSTLGPDGHKWFYINQVNESLTAHTSFKSVVFRTNLLPIRNENIVSNEFANNIIEPILTDYSITNFNGNREVISFYNQSPYRLIDLQGTTPLQSIDIQLFWRDDQNVLRYIYVYPGQKINIKLAFISKGLTN